MKRWMVAVLAVMLAGSAPASLLPAGTTELGVSGLLDFDTPADTLITLDLSYGYFVQDNIEAGMSAYFRNDDNYTLWSVGLFGEYNFDIGTGMMPFMGLDLSLAHAEGGIPERESDAVILGARGGAKYFVTEFLALSAQLVLEAATDDIFLTEEGLESTDARIELGLRVYF